MKSKKQVDALVDEWKQQGLSKSEIVRNKAEACLGWPYAWGAVGALCTPEKRRYYQGRSGIAPGDIELIRKHCPVLSGTADNCNGCMYYPECERVEINDCQGFVKRMFAAVNIKFTGGGCTSMWNDIDNWDMRGQISDMPDVVCCVFKHSGSTGKKEHIGVHVGGGRVIHCAVEVKVGKVTDRGWTHFAVPKGMDGDLPVWRSTVRKGSVGEDVKYVQETLQRLGYDIGSSGADGKFGKKTEAAVKAFQQDNGLSADGVVGPMTYQKLEEVAPDGSLYTVTIPHLPYYKAEALIKQYTGSIMVKEEEENG